MKELSTEEKAKRYEEVLAMAMAKECIIYVPDEAVNRHMLNMFPELKESEDDRIRESIIGFLTMISSLRDGKTLCNEDFDAKVILEWVAWLEKQREQKYVDKIEPKFHEGDWVVTDKGDTVQIGTVNNDYYTIGNGMLFSMPYVDAFWHLWTIKDAKEGDVLVNKSGSVFIYAGWEEGKRVTVDDYCYITASHDEFCIEKHKTGSWYYIDELYPATKEQRNLLFAKMKDAGYEWDDKKKELKKMN